MASLLQTFKRSDFQRVKGSGKTERFINLITKKEVSRRTRDAAVRGISNEKLAIANKAIDEAAQLARPAKGRSSIQKLAPEIKADIVKVRKEEKVRKIQNQKSLSEQKKIDRAIEAAKNKKIIVPKKVTGQMLRAGSIARKIPFETYEEYLHLLQSAKDSGIVFAYALGWRGIDNRVGRERDVTVFTVRYIKDKPYTEARFYGEMATSIEDKASYMDFMHYWIHLAFNIKYARDKAQKAGKRIDKRKSK